MMELLLIGDGHCSTAIDVIGLKGRFQIRGIVQRKEDGNGPVSGDPILGDDADLRHLLEEKKNAFVTVGQIKPAAIRRGISLRLRELQAPLPLIVSPQAYVPRHARVGEETLLADGAMINALVGVGENCVINSVAPAEYDAEVDDHVRVSTGAWVNEGVSIESGCFIDSGAVPHERICVGVNSVIDAGCVVKRDVTPGSVLQNRP